MHDQNNAARRVAQESCLVPPRGSPCAVELADVEPRSAPERAVFAWISLVTAALAWRLVHFVNRYAVDVLSGDQWDLWDGLFHDAGIWKLWRFQWGPHRQGLGALVTLVTARLSGWNLRAESFVCTGIVVLACVAALALVRVVRGRWAITDAIVPVVVLTFSQFELLVVTTNPAHGPLPLLLAFLFVLALWVRSTRLRLALLVGLHAVMTHTGFAFIFALLVPPFFALQLWSAIRRRTEVGLHAAALLASVASTVLFFTNYRFDPAVACFQFPDPQPFRYVLGAGHLYASQISVAPALRPLFGAAGLAAGLGCVALVVWSGWRTLATEGTSNAHTAVFLLSGSSLLFVTTAVVGRVCLGPEALYTSRYSPYVIPFIVAAYVAVGSEVRRSTARAVLIAAFCGVCVAREPLIGTKAPALIASQKRAFQACYLRTGNAEECERRSPVYSAPDDTQMAAKLRYLREHKLSFFRDARAITSVGAARSAVQTGQAHN